MVSYLLRFFKMLFILMVLEVRQRLGLADQCYDEPVCTDLLDKYKAL